jgi:hypothetical protein
VVDALESQGHDVVAMSRSSGVNVISGDGLPEALAGVESVIDTASGPSPEENEATDFFTTAARNLQQAGQRAGVRRMVERGRRPATRPARRARRPDVRGVARLGILSAVGPRCRCRVRDFH